jgi:TnpA family transposase
VLTTYTHVSDQWSTYGTKIIVPTAREAHFVLDDFLGNATDLPIAEHATDTHSATLITFALFDLVGKALTPRMRDLTRRGGTGQTRHQRLAAVAARATARAGADTLTRPAPRSMKGDGAGG